MEEKLLSFVPEPFYSRTAQIVILHIVRVSSKLNYVL